MIGSKIIKTVKLSIENTGRVNAKESSSGIFIVTSQMFLKNTVLSIKMKETFIGVKFFCETQRKTPVPKSLFK